jgi:hypothetical protein
MHWQAVTAGRAEDKTERYCSRFWGETEEKKTPASTGALSGGIVSLDGSLLESLAKLLQPWTVPVIKAIDAAAIA